MKTSKISQSETSFNSSYNFPKDTHIRKTPTNQYKRKKELLCKISFEIDGEEEELLIYQQATLDQITNQLLQKINSYDSMEEGALEKVTTQQKKALKEEIKSKIQVTMESCIEKNVKTEKWKKKLKEIIEQNQKTPIESLSAYVTRRDLCQNKPKSINYFNYNFFKNLQSDDLSLLDQSSENKSLEIIHRAKNLQNELLNRSEKKEMGQKTNRLYELSKRNETVKSQLLRMREQSEEKEMFSQCTFHPNIQRLQNNYKKGNMINQKQRNSVFKRLYKEALDKQEMAKLIQKQVTQKQEQELKKLNFVPKINQCSKEIANLKKKLHQKHGISIYETLYEEGFKKIKQPQINKNLTFHPILCKASQKIIQKSRSSKTMLKNLFSSKDRITMKTEIAIQNEVTYPFCNLSSNKKEANLKYQKQSLRKKEQKDKENYPSQLKTFKAKSYQKRLHLDTSAVLNGKNENNKNQQINALSTKSLRQKLINQTNMWSQSKQQPKTQQTKQNDNNQVYEEKRKTQLDKKLNFLLMAGQRSLRQLELNKNEQIEKKQKRKQRLNPFQFFKLQDTKKQTSTKHIYPEEKHHQGSQTFKTISNEMKSKIFSNLFSLLNNSEKQQIDSSSIYNCQQIPNHLRKVLYPMAQQMQQLNVGLDYQEFIWSITRVCQSLSPKEQSHFIEWGKQLDIVHQCWG